MQLQDREKHSKVRAEDCSVTVNVIEAVAAREDEDPLELPPLADVVDPEALDELTGAGSDSELMISFTYAGYRIAVSGDGSVRVDE